MPRFVLTNNAIIPLLNALTPGIRALSVATHPAISELDTLVYPSADCLATFNTPIIFMDELFRRQSICDGNFPVQSGINDGPFGPNQTCLVGADVAVFLTRHFIQGFRSESADLTLEKVLDFLT